MRLQQLIPFLLVPWLLTAAHANPYEMTLKNGMRVIVKEDRRAPTAVQMVWYRVGSVDEVDGTSGVAHVLEHMMFKGTPSVGPGEFNKRVAAAGGRDNAFTSRDYTAYYQQVPKEKLEEMMQLEADRMRHLNVEKTIRPALARGEWVLCDRFIDSTRAYQGGAGGLSDSDIMALHGVGSAGLMPDRTLVLTLDLDQAAGRAEARDGGKADRFALQHKQYHQDVANAFQAMVVASPERMRLVSAVGSPEEVTARSLAALGDLL